jgi:hypothetical protein
VNDTLRVNKLSLSIGVSFAWFQPLAAKTPAMVTYYGQGKKDFPFFLDERRL